MARLLTGAYSGERATGYRELLSNNNMIFAKLDFDEITLLLDNYARCGLLALLCFAAVNRLT
jgi:hypothetical protein